MKSLLKLIVVTQLCLVSCSVDERGEGILEVELFGEDFIESGIPSSAFADGYAVYFDTFLINVGKVTVTTSGEASELVLPEMKIWDLTEEGPVNLARIAYPEGEIESAGYTIARATAKSQPGNGSPELHKMMMDNGYSVYVAGQAVKGDRAISFSWGFDREADYGPCHVESALEDGGELTIQLTIHGDHLFYDDAVSESPSLRFEDIALADSDNNGTTSDAELAEYDIGILPNYAVGNLEIENLWEFISHMTTTLGHLNGEGHCFF